MKLAHFSDIHLGREDADLCRFDWLLQDALARGAEHVLIAGDILDHGNLADIAHLRKILRDNEIWSPDRLTVVPGNHDIIGGSRHFCRGLVGDRTSKRRHRRKKFIRAFSGMRVGALRGRRSTFAHMKLIGNVALLGIDTTDPEFRTNGYIGSSQLKDLSHLLDIARRKKRFPVVVGHHRPIDVASDDMPRLYQLHGWLLGEDMNLKNSDSLLKVLAQSGCSLYLCGHWHVLPDDEYYQRRDGVRVWTQGRAGAVDQDETMGDLRYSYDLISVSGGKVRRSTIEFSRDEIDDDIWPSESHR